MQEGTHRIVLAGGGTGGHLYPALAVAGELKRRHPRAEIVFVGTRQGLEQRLVPAAGYPLVTLSLSGLKGASAAGRIRAAAGAAWAVLRCVLWMLRRPPALVIGVGGYVSGPAVLAAKLVRTKTMVLEQNHFPGATNRWLAPRVDAVCLPSEAARARVRGRTYVTGNPVRREFFAVGDPEPRDEVCLLAFGGSRGARSINHALAGSLDSLARIRPPLRILHQTGTEDEARMREAYARFPVGRHEVAAFFDDMPARFAAAEIVVCRAGASTLAELCAAGRPAILVPYPHAADDHQRHNAETLRDAGAAQIIPDQELDGGRLAARIAELAGNPALRRSMGRAARALARPDATDRIADIADRLLSSDRNEDR